MSADYSQWVPTVFPAGVTLVAHKVRPTWHWYIPDATTTWLNQVAPLADAIRNAGHNAGTGTVDGIIAEMKKKGVL